MSYSPKTGNSCGCKRGLERDNCPQCEGTGQQIDFARIHRERRAELNHPSEHEDNCMRNHFHNAETCDCGRGNGEFTINNLLLQAKKYAENNLSMSCCNMVKEYCQCGPTYMLAELPRVFVVTQGDLHD